MRQLMLFCVGGVIGFIIDAGIVQWLVTVHHGNPYTSRLLSFVCAGTGTWLFNRHYTFQGVRLYGKFGEWARYMFAMTGGQLSVIQVLDLPRQAFRSAVAGPNGSSRQR